MIQSSTTSDEALRAAVLAADEWLKRRDKELFARKATFSEAWEEFTEANEFSGKLTFKEFKVRARAVCTYWKNAVRLRKASTANLSEEEWDKVRSAVLQESVTLRGLNLFAAAEVMRTKIVCSPEVLNGLTERYRFWEMESQ